MYDYERRSKAIYPIPNAFGQRKTHTMSEHRAFAEGLLPVGGNICFVTQKVPGYKQGK